MRVALAGFDDPGFRAALEARGARVGAPEPGLDLVFYMVRQPADLAEVGELRPLIKDTGAIWVLREKGPRRAVSDVDVIDAGRSFQLVDNKIASFSDTLAAMRLVVPLNRRAT